MWSIVLLVFAVIGIFVGRNIAATIDSEEIAEHGLVLVVLFALVVTIPMLFFSYGYVGYYLLAIIFGLNITFWESILIIFLIRMLVKKG